MKKFNVKLTLLAGLVAGAMAACNGNHKAAATDSITTTKTDSTQTVVTDTGKMAADTAFANKAAIGGMAEVALGKLALSKTSNAKIKEFAQRMVTDHGKANAELAGIAKNKNMNIPTSIDAIHQAKMDSLQALSGSAFDKGYVMTMIDGHNQTLTLMQTEAANGKDADLKAFAAKTAPVVKMHLDMINKIHDSMK